MKKSHLILAGASAIALTGISSDEAKAQYISTDSSPRRLPTLSINTSNGASCNGGGGSQSSVNIGTSYGQNGEIRLGAVLVIPLGNNSNPCNSFAKMEDKLIKLRYLEELRTYSLITEDEYNQKIKEYKLLELS